MTHGSRYLIFYFFFFNDTATTEIYTLSLHDALPICHEYHLPSDGRVATVPVGYGDGVPRSTRTRPRVPAERGKDRKSTRLNSSHLVISYAVFCFKTKHEMLMQDNSNGTILDCCSRRC